MLGPWGQPEGEGKVVASLLWGRAGKSQETRGPLPWLLTPATVTEQQQLCRPLFQVETGPQTLQPANAQLRAVPSSSNQASSPLPRRSLGLHLGPLAEFSRSDLQVAPVRATAAVRATQGLQMPSPAQLPLALISKGCPKLHHGLAPLEEHLGRLPRATWRPSAALWLACAGGRVGSCPSPSVGSWSLSSQRPEGPAHWAGALAASY